MDKTFYIAELIVKDIKGTINDSEKSELEVWLNENPANVETYNNAKNTKQQLSKFEVYQMVDAKKSWSNIESELFGTKTINFFPQKVLRYAAAILLPLIIIGGAGYLFLKPNKIETIASVDTIIKPGSQKATLILSNGGTVDLEHEATPEQIAESDAIITNIDKKLSYNTDKETKKTKSLIYNELITPRGGGYNLMLADGTEVWLNADSKIKFPVAFTDSTRKVFLEGEAYFKVTHNGKPFIVNSENMDVRVLGTSFNVSAYKNDSEIKTTLVEGKVQVNYTTNENSGSVSKILTPNMQAVISKDDSDIEINKVNTTQYTSWLEGKIEFDNESLSEVMKRLARWYDFEYEFENDKAKNFHFSARISNEESISNIFTMLEMTTEVKFEMKSNTIVIL